MKALLLVMLLAGCGGHYQDPEETQDQPKTRIPVYCKKDPRLCS